MDGMKSDDLHYEMEELCIVMTMTKIFWNIMNYLNKEIVNKEKLVLHFRN